MEELNFDEILLIADPNTAMGNWYEKSVLIEMLHLKLREWKNKFSLTGIVLK